MTVGWLVALLGCVTLLAVLYRRAQLRVSGSASGVDLIAGALGAAVLSIASHRAHGSVSNIMVSAIAGNVLALAALADLRTGLIFDAITIPASCMIAVVSALTGDFEKACAGAMIASAVVATLFLATRGKGIGFGDVKLCTVVGAAQGVGALWVLYYAFIAAGVCAAILWCAGKASAKMKMPFAPFIALGAAMHGITPGTEL